jgi:hypothetical protein
MPETAHPARSATDDPTPIGRPGAAVTAWHVAPIAYVPRRGRKARLGFERVATAIRTVEADDADFVPVPRSGDPDLIADFYQEEAYAFAGSVFSPLRRYGSPATPDCFLEHLTRRDPNPDGGRYAADLAGTPLAAHAASRMGGDPDGVDEGVDRARLDPGSVLFEDRGNASQALRRYLSQDVVLTPTRVMVRRPPLVRVRLQQGESDAFVEGFPTFDVRHPPLVRPDRAAGVAEAYAHPYYAPLLEADLDPVARRFPAALLGDDDLHLLANRLPDRTLLLLDLALPRTATTFSRAGARDAVEAVRASIVPLALRGRMGGVLPGAAAHALEASLSALRTIEARAQASIVHLGEAFQKVPELMRYVEGHALPRLGMRVGPEADAADEDALADLVP